MGKILEQEFHQRGYSENYKQMKVLGVITYQESG